MITVHYLAAHGLENSQLSAGVGDFSNKYIFS